MSNETTATETNVEIVTLAKMSVMTLGASGRKILGLPEGTEHAKLAQIYGTASGIKMVVNKETGDTFEAITGNFEGVNLSNGKVFRSGVLYLPSGIHEQLSSEVKKLVNDSDSIQFAIEIRSVLATSKAGYSYQGVSLLPPAQVDPLSAIREAVASRKQLPATTAKDAKK